MAANRGMVAGSHNRNEFVMIRHDGDAPAPGKEVKGAGGQGCQICGDTVGVSATGDVFVACNECAFPVCRPCYEYERKDGVKCCPQCKTRYKRLKGSPRVPGDEEEEDVDDLDNEFNYKQGNGKGPEWQLQGQGEDIDLSSSSRHEPHHRIPRLTSGQQISGEIPDASSDRHSIRSPTSSYIDPSVPGALSDALRCRMLRPDWAKACYRQATAHMLLKEYKQACHALLDAQKLDPGNAEIERELGKARELMKNPPAEGEH